MLVGDLLRKSAKLYRDCPFIFHNDLTLTYGEFNERVNRLAIALQERGFNKGDRLALLIKNSPHYLECYFAASKIGVAVVTLNPGLYYKEYIYMLEDSEPTGIVFDQKFLNLVKAIDDRVQSVNTFICLGEKRGMIEAYEEMIQNSVSHEPAASIDEGDDMQLIYSNATSGYPRAAVLTHKNLIITGLSILVEAHFYLPETKVLLVAPLFHIGPTIITIATLFLGRSINIKREFNPQVTVNALSEELCTHTFMVPAMIQSLFTVADIQERDYRHLKYMLYGSAPMHASILKKAMEIFRCKFIQGYGLTESTGVLGLLQHEEHETHWGANCRECLTAELRVVNQQGEDVKPGGEIGEIIARGPGIMKGYWRSPEQTQKVLQDGWLRTGDMAFIDRDGYITLVDRCKDMIIKGGENIYPAELERVITCHPSVRRVAVIAIPDTTWGEEIMALIELKDGCSVSEMEIRQFLRDHISSFKRPRSIQFRDALPILPDGTVDKKSLKEKFWKGYEKRIH